MQKIEARIYAYTFIQLRFLYNKIIFKILGKNLLIYLISLIYEEAIVPGTRKLQKLRCTPGNEF